LWRALEAQNLVLSYRMGKVTEPGPGVSTLSTALCALCTSRSDAHRPTLHTHTHSHTLSLQHSHTHHTPRHSASSQSQLSPTHGEPPGPYSLTHTSACAAPRRNNDTQWPVVLLITSCHQQPTAARSQRTSHPPLPHVPTRALLVELTRRRDTRPWTVGGRARRTARRAGSRAPGAGCCRQQRRRGVSWRVVASARGRLSAWSPQRVVASARGRLSAWSPQRSPSAERTRILCQDRVRACAGEGACSVGARAAAAMVGARAAEGRCRGGECACCKVS
jgi:hypothetical protein